MGEINPLPLTFQDQAVRSIDLCNIKISSEIIFWGECRDSNPNPGHENTNLCAGLPIPFSLNSLKHFDQKNSFENFRWNDFFSISGQKKIKTIRFISFFLTKLNGQTNRTVSAKIKTDQVSNSELREKWFLKDIAVSGFFEEAEQPPPEFDQKRVILRPRLSSNVFGSFPLALLERPPVEKRFGGMTTATGQAWSRHKYLTL